jgi:hypothetical protein
VNLKKFATVTKFRLRRRDCLAILNVGSLVNNVEEALRFTLCGVGDYAVSTITRGLRLNEVYD